MKKIIKLALLVAAAAFLTYSCDPREAETEQAADYLESVTVSNDPGGNVLRLLVNTTFVQDCSYTISYWVKGRPETKYTTSMRQSSGLHGEDLILFLYPNSTYEFTIDVAGARSTVSSEPMEFETFSLPADMPSFTLVQTDNSAIPGYYMQTQIAKAGYVSLADMDGNVIWYQYIDQPCRQYSYNPETGNLWMMTGYKINSSGVFQRLTRRIMCIDIFGNVLHEWSVRDGEIDIPYPHHEIREMPDGNVVVVCNYTDEFDLSGRGGKENTTVYGDGYAIFSPTDGTVLKTWNTFAEADPLTCTFADPVADDVDMLHANSFNWDSEGNYYMTFNHCSQLWKIDPETGEVLYRVGPGGNVDIDPSGYASGLHANIPLAPDRVLCLDNGQNEGSVSRAIIYKVNPAAMTAEVELSVSLPHEYFSGDRSNVQLICDGSLLMFGMTVPGFMVVTDLEGNIKRAVNRTGMSYRTEYFESLPRY